MDYREEVLRTCPDAAAIEAEKDSEKKVAMKFHILGNAALGIVNECIELFLEASSFVTRDVTDCSSYNDYMSEIGDLAWYCELASYCMDSVTTEAFDYSKHIRHRFPSLCTVGEKAGEVEPLYTKNGFCNSMRNAKILEDYGFSWLMLHSKNFSELYKKCAYQGKDYNLFKPIMVQELDAILHAMHCLGEAWMIPISYARLMNTQKLRARYPDGFSVERSENRNGG